MEPYDIIIEGDTVKKVFQTINTIPLYIAAATLVVAITIMVINVITRYVFGFTVAGYEEVVVTCFSFTVFFGSAYAFYEGMHYGVDALMNKLPQKMGIFMAIVKDLIIIAVCLYIAKLSLSLATKAWTKLMPATNIPYFFFDIPVFFSFALMSIYSILDLVKDVTSLFQKKPDSNEEI